jgi:transcriptional regulator with XRE-family HTH domain
MVCARPPHVQRESHKELARRSGLSRTGICAIETSRIIIPSTAADLGLAASLGCRVEELFNLRPSESRGSEWAWLPGTTPVGTGLLKWAVPSVCTLWRRPARRNELTSQCFVTAAKADATRLLSKRTIEI